MIGPYVIHGHAIVSADDYIADPDGRVPPELHNQADWDRFQTALDRAAAIVLGRLSHEANPNARSRNRIVMSSSVDGIARRGDAWWWNPETLPFAEAIATAAPGGGVVAVPGGQAVFDFFLPLGFDEFHLARARRATLGDGIPIFSACVEGGSAETVLARHGLIARDTLELDPAAGVSLTVYVRKSAARD